MPSMKHFDWKLFVMLCAILPTLAFSNPTGRRTANCYECGKFGTPTKDDIEECDQQNRANWKVRDCDRGCALMMDVSTGHTFYRGCAQQENMNRCDTINFNGHEGMLCQCANDQCNEVPVLTDENKVESKECEMGPSNFYVYIISLACYSCVVDPRGNFRSTSENSAIRYCNPKDNLWFVEECSQGEVCYNSTFAIKEFDGVILYGCANRMNAISNDCRWVNRTLGNGHLLESMKTCHCPHDLCNVQKIDNHDHSPSPRNESILAGIMKADIRERPTEAFAREATTNGDKNSLDHNNFLWFFVIVLVVSLL